MQKLDEKLKQARAATWDTFGKFILFYVPGMFTYHGLTGKYSALSITGDRCALQCDHCQAKILEPMIPATTAERLVSACCRLAERGDHGVLLSGGCDEKGRLPWDHFFEAIAEVKRRTHLYISVHCGLLNQETAAQLKASGVDQALIDVIGDDETYQKIYHVGFGVSRIMTSLEALQKAGLSVIPHIVLGLHYGQMKGEKKAVEMVSRFDIEQVVIVSLMKIPGTPVWQSPPVKAETVAEMIAETRFALPKTRISLGCARQRGDTRAEILAIDAGVNRMALPSEEAIQHAKNYGLEIRYQMTCCSVSADFSKEALEP